MKRLFKKLVKLVSQFELFKPSQDVYDIYFQTIKYGGYYIDELYCKTLIWDEPDVFTTVFEPYIKRYKLFNMEYKLKDEGDRDLVKNVVREIELKLQSKYKIKEQDIWIHEDETDF